MGGGGGTYLSSFSVVLTARDEDKPLSFTTTYRDAVRPQV